MAEPASFNCLAALAQHLRAELESKKFILLYAYNGVGKTRLSTEFKNLGKDAEDEDKRDTLYFNALMPMCCMVFCVSIMMPRTPVGETAFGFQCDSW